MTHSTTVVTTKEPVNASAARHGGRGSTATAAIPPITAIVAPLLSLIRISSAAKAPPSAARSTTVREPTRTRSAWRSAATAASAASATAATCGSSLGAIQRASESRASVPSTAHAHPSPRRRASSVPATSPTCARTAKAKASVPCTG